MKVNELIDAALNKLVAKAEGKEVYVHNGHCFIVAKQRDWGENPSGRYSPSTDWSQGGPIIDREGISLGETYTPTSPRKATICNGPANEAITERGETNLIAAMRCFVASKFGDEVDDS